jgi:6-phosphogluconolactonase (cycloisomerase 2 family)
MLVQSMVFRMVKLFTTATAIAVSSMQADSTADQPTQATPSKQPAACRTCPECQTAICQGMICEHCATKLTAAAVRGTVTVGPSKTMMATNDMMQADSSFVYTLDNDLERNSVAVYRRGPDGTLMPLVGSPFNAGGKGLTGGDIDEQGAIRVAGKYVLAVNPGSDTIAVLEKTSRGLLHVDGSPFPSYGSTPLSLAVHGDLVYVANQAADFAMPKSKPNLVGFRLSKDGRLTPIAGAKVEFPAGMGPAQVELAANGKLLVATAGFQVNEGEGSRVYSFQVADGKLIQGENSPLKPEGATGTVGFSINAAADRIYVSTFKASGVVTLEVNPKTAAIRQMGMPSANDQRAACWTVLTKDGRTLYVGNFVSNSISVYDVAPNKPLTLLGSIPRRGATNKDTKDIELSRDGQYLYAVGSGARQVSIFRIEGNRLLTELPIGQSPVMLPTGQNITGLAVD